MSAAARWRECLDAVARNPGAASPRRRAVQVAAQQGRHAEVCRLVEEAMARGPLAAGLWEAWARAGLALGRGGAALARLQREAAVAGTSGGAEAPAAVQARLLIELGRSAQAARAAAQALAKAPRSDALWAALAWAQAAGGNGPQARATLARVSADGLADGHTAELVARAALAVGEQARALASLRAGVGQDPESVAALSLLGAMEVSRGDLAEGTRVLEQLVSRWPDATPAWANLGTARAQAGQLHAARAAFARIPARASPALRRQRAVFEATHGNPRAAIAELESLVDALGPLPALVQSLAHAAGRAGEHSRVVELVGPAVAGGRAGANALAAWGVAQRRLGRPGDALGALRQRLERTRSPGERTLLGHVLGDCLHALGDVDGAFSAHSTAHAAQTLRFPPHEMEDAAAAIAARFGPDRFAELAPAEDAAGQPGQGVVLVVGMPRSGTSMVEQIIAAHPDGAGAGELPFLGEVAGHDGRLGGLEHLDRLLGQPPAVRAALGRRYEQLQRGHASKPDARVVVDKLPGNFLHLGAAAALLPGARIVHCRRDPLDTCLSCYFQNFSTAYAPFTRLDTLGWFYRGYADLMDHWERCSLSPMLALDYARTVGSLETEVRRLLAFVGLDFHPASLAFHRSERAVPTASYDQVRQPVYQSSVGRSRRYLAHLGPLLTALGDRAPAELRSGREPPGRAT